MSVVGGLWPLLFESVVVLKRMQSEQTVPNSAFDFILNCLSSWNERRWLLLCHYVENCLGLSESVLVILQQFFFVWQLEERRRFVFDR